MTGKYEALKEHLESLRVDRWNPDFTEVERILGFDLPPSARKYKPWWANPEPDSGHPFAGSWMEAGWKVEKVDFNAQTVVFCRIHALSSGEDTDMLKCELQLRWKPSGTVTISHGLVSFPEALREVPGLYRLEIAPIDGPERRYVGETDNLSQRFIFYRHPGKSQATNARINLEIREAIDSGAEITLSIATDEAWIIREGVKQAADLSEKAVRQLFASFVQVVEGDIDIESLTR